MSFIKGLILKIWKIIRVILILIACYMFWMAFTGNFASVLGNIATFLFGVIPAAIVVLVEILRKGLSTKCPKCNNMFALEKEDTEFIGTEDIQVKVAGNTYNRDGEIVGKQEQYIPGKRKIYHENYTCKKCGYACYLTKTKDKANV